MIRLLCDRCNRDVTNDPKHGSIGGIEDGDQHGDGTCTDNYNIVCADCFAGFRTYMGVIKAFEKETAKLAARADRRALAKAVAGRQLRRP